MTPHSGCFRITLSTHVIKWSCIFAYSVIWVKYIHAISIQENFLGNFFGMILSQITSNYFSSRLLNLLYTWSYSCDTTGGRPYSLCLHNFYNMSLVLLSRFACLKFRWLLNSLRYWKQYWLKAAVGTLELYLVYWKIDMCPIHRNVWYTLLDRYCCMDMRHGY